MKFSQLPLEKTGQFAPLFTDYLNQKPSLTPFFRAAPDVKGFESILKDFSFPQEKRKTLADSLSAQYKDIPLPEPVENNISLLREDNTFTITTGHQLCLLTGPLYFIYKIVTTINLAKKLKTIHPDKNFIPVYWMASEDHDFEEINHFFLFNKKYTWEKETSGAVGYLPTDDLTSIFKEINEALPEIREAYLESHNLAEATRKLVNHLFGKDGLVIIDPDDKKLKQLFSPIVKDELTSQTTNDLVIEQSSMLSSMGYKPQIFPREINFFYMKGDIRERIVEKNEHYEILNSSQRFSKEEILSLADQSPEVFSPNVVLRPVYQQVILPNICYIGGPAEVCYWLQLKPVFDNYDVEFPILLPRNFGLIIPKNIREKIQKLNLSDEDIFLDTVDLKKLFLSEDEEKPTLKQQKQQLHDLFIEIMNIAEDLDPSLKGYVGAEETKALKSFTNIEKRLEKTHESRFEIQVKQLESIKEKLFPDGKLQERRDNFLNFYINNPNFIKELLENFDPLSKDFYLIHND